MSASVASISGASLLAQLLGQDLASNLLDPSRQATGGAPAKSATPPSAHTLEDELFLSPEAKQLLIQIEDTTLKYGTGKPGDDFFGPVGPSPGRVAGQTTHQSSVTAQVDVGEVDGLPDASQGVRNLYASTITWGWNKAGQETASIDSLDVNRDANGTLNIHLGQFEGVSDVLGDSVQSAGYSLGIATDGDVTFNQDQSASTVKADAPGSREVSWNDDELSLRNTSSGLVVTETRDTGADYQGPAASPGVSVQARVSALVSGSPRPLTDADVALQVLADDKSTQAKQGEPRHAQGSDDRLQVTAR